MPNSKPASYSDSGRHRNAQEQMAILATYYRWIFSHFKPPYGDCVLDAGCGIGNATEFLLPHASQVVACDIDQGNLDRLCDRFPGDSGLLMECVDLDSNELEGLKGHRFSSIVCLDFLEHINDDRRLLRHFHSVSKVGARLLLKVPAGPRLYCSIDRASGHYRRYAQRQLTRLLQEAGWDPLFVRPMNLAGILPYWINGKLRGQRRNFSRTFSPQFLRLIAKLMPLLQFMDQVGPAFGLSLVAEAAHRTKPEFNSR